MSIRSAAAEAGPREDPMNNVEAECRKAGCGERTPRPMSVKDASEWMMTHGRQAHDNPYLGAKWTPAREPRDGAERIYVTEISVPLLGDGGIQRLHSQMPDPEPPPAELEAGS